MKKKLCIYFLNLFLISNLNNNNTEFNIVICILYIQLPVRGGGVYFAWQ